MQTLDLDNDKARLLPYNVFKQLGKSKEPSNEGPE